MLTSSLSGEYALTPIVTVNINARIVLVNGRPAHLRPECFDALLLLMEYRLRDAYVPYEAFDKISREVKTSNVRMLSDETVRTVIKDLRKVIGRDNIDVRTKLGYWLVPIPVPFSITKANIENTDHFSIGDIVLGGWELVRLLGSGISGKVFEAHRIIDGTMHKAAIKIISIPSSPSYTEHALETTIPLPSLHDYYSEAVAHVMREVGILSGDQGCNHLVSYEEHQIIAHSDGLGYEVVIRMEYLTPVTEHFKAHPPTPREIVLLGLDICKALSFCEKRHLLHRDIKPSNIYIDSNNRYKLGDFGTSCAIESMGQVRSAAGTLSYISPEAHRNDSSIDFRTDIYSLGLVMYQRLNGGRIPFVPESGIISVSDANKYVMKRLSGEPIPPIAGIDRKLSDVITKACAFAPQDRYSTAAEFRSALTAILQPK